MDTYILQCLLLQNREEKAGHSILAVRRHDVRDGRMFEYAKSRLDQITC